MTSQAISKSAHPSRREFLYYLLGASGVCLATGTCGALAWHLLPHVHFGPDSGVFLLDVEAVPLPETKPIYFREGKLYLSNSAEGLLALNMQCAYDKIRIIWVPANQRFECPACGSKYRLNGVYIEGPAERNLDRFVTEVTTSNGVVRTSPEGEPVSLMGATRIIVDTRYKILGKPRPVM